MSVTQLIYVSRLKHDITATTLENIVRGSAVKNRRLDVTGVLLAHGHSLLQLLEGSADTLERLFATIKADPRHDSIERLLTKEVRRRLYPEWAMTLADLRASVDLDHGRLARLVTDVQRTTDTGAFSVEARILVRDFELQSASAA